MNRLASIPAATLVLALAACATQGGGSADSGWVTLLDGANGIDNF